MFYKIAKFLDILVQAQSRGVHSKITLQAKLTHTVLQFMQNVNYA